jgi:hypothetical protein
MLSTKKTGFRLWRKRESQKAEVKGQKLKIQRGTRNLKLLDFEP